METDDRFKVNEYIDQAEHGFVSSEHSLSFSNELSGSSEGKSSKDEVIEDVRGTLDDPTPHFDVFNSDYEEKEREQRGIDSLSVIIPALNEEHYAPKLLSSLVKQEFRGDLQVIVVDGQSEDNTIKAAMEYENKLDLKVISSERDIGKQRNEGAKVAKHPHLLFLDADVIMPRNMLNRFTSKINPNQRIVDTVVIVPHPLKFVDTVGGMYGNLVLGLINKFEPAMTGQFLLTTQENHQKVGGFAEGTIIGEDLDYVLRSSADGAKTHKHMFDYVFSSTRRGDLMGRASFISSWAKAYFYVRRHGPIYENFNYPFGNYKK